jgi:hypothetical protein
MKTVIGGVVNTVGVELIPVVEDIINQIKDWALANGSLMAQDIKRFIKQSIPVIKDIAAAVMFVVTGIRDLIGALGGWKPAMAIATTATIAFKVAMAGALGPIQAIALGIAAMLPVLADMADGFGGIQDKIEAIDAASKELAGVGPGFVFANKEIEKEIRKAEADRRRGVRISKTDDVEGQRVGAAAQIQAEKRLNRAKAENKRLLAERDKAEGERATAAQEKKTRGEARKVRSDRIAELDKAGKLKKGRGLEKRKNDFMMGKISESELIGKPKRGRRGGGRSPAPAKEPESDVSLAESLLAIRTGTADPKQLKQVIQQLSRKTPSSKSIRPTVAIDFFNFVITQNIKGANPTQIAKESAMAIRGEFEKQTAKAGQTVPTGIAR